jgi:iron-sulfur cluster repair protein YtfE (RIC family)
MPTARQDPSVACLHDQPNDVLIEHLRRRHHQPLREGVVRLDALCAHGGDAQLSRSVRELRCCVLEHLDTAEGTLFPRLLSAHASDASGPIGTMRGERQEIEALLATTRECAPPGTDPLSQALNEVERELHAYFGVQNDLLFPRGQFGT